MKHRTRLILRSIFTILSILMIGFIFLHSAMTADDSSWESGVIADFINGILHGMGIPISLRDSVVRKMAHFTEFAVWGMLLSVTVYLYVSRRLRTFLIVLPMGLAVAVCDELSQLFSEGRSCEIRDMLIDFGGVFVAALIVQLVLFLIARYKGKKEGNGIERADTE